MPASSTELFDELMGVGPAAGRGTARRVITTTSLPVPVARCRTQKCTQPAAGAPFQMHLQWRPDEAAALPSPVPG